MLIQDIKKFVTTNKTHLAICAFFLIIAYGYFVTHWAISIDSEKTTFFSSTDILKGWTKEGRFLNGPLVFLSNNKIIPFWNDFFSVALLFLSSIILSTGLSRIKENKDGLLIFSLAYIIAPIYSFYLRFTTYNVLIGIGLILSSLTIYYLITLLNQEKFNKKIFLISTLFLFFAINIYQMFAVYYITGALLVTSYKTLAEENQWKIIYKIFFTSLTSLLMALMLYKLTAILIYHFIPSSNYTNIFMQWGKTPAPEIIRNLKYYFHQVLVEYHFNFFILITFLSCIIFCGFLFRAPAKNFHLIVLIPAIFASAFLMPLAFGYAMPLRTLQPVPLMLASTWLIMHTSTSSQCLKKTILALVLICSIFNSQYITRIFYGDDMRLQYDINYGNRIYADVINTTKNSLTTKPLIIIGAHSSPEKPFILKSEFDTIGLSLFEWGDTERIYDFMSWLGNDFIKPSQEEENLALKSSYTMPNYPKKGSIIEENNFIILKLSPGIVPKNQRPITLELNHYKKINDNLLNFNLDKIVNKDNLLQLNGWAYIKGLDASNSTPFLDFRSKKNQYIFPINVSYREDVAKKMKDGRNLKNSGFDGTITETSLQGGTYKVYLILTNNSQYSEKLIDEIIIKH